MGLDIRWPIGFMFSLIGVLLLVQYGIAGASEKTLNIKVDLWWGIVLLIFGVLMLLGAYRGSKKKPPSA